MYKIHSLAFVFHSNKMQICCAKINHLHNVKKFTNMATIKALIRATKGKDTAFVRFRLSDGRNVQLFYKSTISVNVSLWDSKKGEISTRKICNNAYRRATNNEIQNTKDRLFEAYERNKKYIKNSNDLAKVMQGKKVGQIESESDLHDICEVIKAYKENNDLSKGSIKLYDELIRIIKRYNIITEREYKVIKFKDIRVITEYEINNFRKFLKNEYKYIKANSDLYDHSTFCDLYKKRAPPQERSENTCIGWLKRLRAVFRFAAKHDIISKTPFENINIGREVYGTPYYLTREERDTLAKYDLSSTPELENVRDTFILQCFIGCRIGDLLRLTRQNISEDLKYLEYLPSKTKKKGAKVVRVPLHEVAREIIQKRKGNEKLIQGCRNTSYINQRLKQIFKKIGFSRMVVVFNPVTRKEEQKPLCDVVSTHMARRTFIGLLYKQVKDPNLIASMSGHAQNSTAFARYRAIDDEIKSEIISLL